MESTSFRNLHCFETQDQNMEIFSNLSPTTVGKNLESSSKFGNNTNQSPQEAQLNEQAFEMMKDFLPEIENELRKEIKAELEKEYSAKYENFLAQTKENARQEIDAIIEDIKEESLKTYKEKMKILEEKENEFLTLKSDFQKQIEFSTIEKLKQDFESEKAQIIKSLMEDLNSQKPTESSLTQKISEKLRIEYEHELKKELQKKEKLLILNMKKKLEVEKKLLQENFELEWKIKLERDLKGVEVEKNEIGRLKSLENLRLKKLEEEKRNMNKEIAEIDKKYSTIINELKKENEELKEVLNRKENEEKIANENPIIQSNNSRNKHFESNSNKKTQRKIEKEKEEEEFQNKYLKSMMLSTKKEDEKKDDFLEKNWIDLQKMINPLSSPIKLLHMFEDKGRENEGKSLEVSGANLKKKETKKNVVGKENRPKRIIIGEYNSKQIAEDIIKLYANHKTIKNQQDKKTENQTPSDPNSKGMLNLQIESNENIASQDFQQKNPFNNRIQINSNINNSSKVFVEENSILSGKSSSKYEEYLKRSKTRKNEENGCKSKRYDEVVKQCMNRYKKEGRGLRTEKNEEFESIFGEKNSDNSKITEMKTLRKDILNRLEKDYNLEEKCAAMQIYIQSDFLKIIKCPDISIYSQIQENLDILIKQWHLYDISFNERINFISTLENMNDNGAFLNKKLEQEIEYLHGTYQSSLDLIEKLVERQKLKARINYEDFSFSVYRNLYNVLRKMDEDIQNTIKNKQYQSENNYFWRGVDIRKMIACDIWEMDYVEKEEMKSEILNKIKKKLL